MTLGTTSPVPAQQFRLSRWSEICKEAHIAPELHQLVVQLSPFPGTDSNGSLQISYAPDQAAQHLSLVDTARADGILQGVHLPCMHTMIVKD